VSDDEKIVKLRLVKNEPAPAEEEDTYSADDILDAAHGELEHVIVMGWGAKDGKLWVGVSPLTYAEILELLEHTKDVLKNARGEQG